MTDSVLEVDTLVKNYGTFRAVDGISFSIPRGSIIGFLGPNGAGKTTTIQILLGITSPSSGNIRYFGTDFAAHRLASLQKINSASAFNTLLGRITVLENLQVYTDLYRVPNAQSVIKKLLERFEISEHAHTLYWNLSAGQKTRVNLIKSLLNDPEILLLDEPTASLDPDIADKTLTLIETLQRERGLSILYTSHNMSEITRICNHVIFLDRGKIVAEDSPTNLVKRITSSLLRLTFSQDARAVLEPYFKERGVAFTFSDAFHVEVPTHEKELPELLFGLSHASKHIIDIEIVKPNLEDVFLEIARTKL